MTPSEELQAAMANLEAVKKKLDNAKKGRTEEAAAEYIEALERRENAVAAVRWELQPKAE